MARKIEIEIIGDAKNFQNSLGKASGSADSFGSSLAKMGKIAALAIGAAGIGGLAIVLKQGIAEFSEAAKVGAQTNAVLASTGGIANVTAGEVSKLAEALMQKSGVDDEAIQSGENMLLTFKNIRNEVGAGNDIFSQATKTTLDFSVAMGKDLPASAILVGKALNDPIKGLTALGRVGVTFTEGQKEMIKGMVESGNVMGAQKLILQELNSEFGGSAEALGKTLPGQLNILKESFNNLAGTMVGAMVPAFTRVAEGAGKFLTKFGEADGASAKFGVAMAAIKSIASDAAKELSSLGPAVAAGVNIAKGALSGFAGVMQSSVGQFGAIAALSAVGFASAMTKIIGAWRSMMLALSTANPVFLAISVGIGLVVAAIVMLKREGDHTSTALRAVKAALDNLKPSADTAAAAELALAEAQNRLKAAALTVTTAIKAKDAAAAAGGKTSLAYKTAENQVEAAYIARRRAALDVTAATVVNTAEQKKATDTQNIARQSVDNLTAGFQNLVARGHEYQSTSAGAAKVTKELSAQLETQSARRFAGEMGELATKASATAKALAESDPALSKLAAGVAKAATAQAKLATEMGKIPGVVSAIKGPAVQNMDAVGRAVAGSATTQGSQVGANFALGMASGIAANASAAAIQAALMVNKAYSSASTAGQMHSPSKLTMKLGEFFVDGFVIGVKNKQAVLAALGSTIVQDFIMGITTKAPEFTGKMAEIAGAAVEAARAKVDAMQGRITEAFGRLGEYAKRAFEEKAKGMADGIAREFEAKIGGIKAFQASLTPAELQLQQMDAAEQARQRASALTAAQAALSKAETMDAGLEKEAAVAAAKEQIRVAENASIRVALEEQAAVERTHRDQAAALQITFLEEAKAKELANLEERTQQQGVKLAEQLTQLQNRLALHPEEYNKIQKKIITLLNSYGVSFKNSGVALGNAFAQGIRNAETAVRNAARALAQAAANQLQLKSPAKEGPLSTLDKWWKPMGPMLAKQMRSAQIAGGAFRLAGAAAGGGGMSARTPAAAMSGGGGGNVQHFHFPNYVGNKRELVDAVRTEVRRVTARNG